MSAIAWNNVIHIHLNAIILVCIFKRIYVYTYMQSVILFRFYWYKWKLWTIWQSWFCFHIFVLLHGTILPPKTTSCSRDLSNFSIFDKMIVRLKFQTCLILPGFISVIRSFRKLPLKFNDFEPVMYNHVYKIRQCLCNL